MATNWRAMDAENLERKKLKLISYYFRRFIIPVDATLELKPCKIRGYINLKFTKLKYQHDGVEIKVNGCYMDYLHRWVYRSKIVLNNEVIQDNFY